MRRPNLDRESAERADPAVQETEPISPGYPRMEHNLDTEKVGPDHPRIDNIATLSQETEPAVEMTRPIDTLNTE